MLIRQLIDFTAHFLLALVMAVGVIHYGILIPAAIEDQFTLVLLLMLAAVLLEKSSSMMPLLSKMNLTSSGLTWMLLAFGFFTLVYTKYPLLYKIFSHLA